MRPVRFACFLTVLVLGLYHGPVTSLPTSCHPSVTANRPATGTDLTSPPLKIAYRLAFQHPASHLFEVELSISGITTPSIRIAMPAWSPGRYAIYDFAKNVQEFTAKDSQSTALPIQKSDKQTWVVATNNIRECTVSYRVYANDLSGTFSILNEQHANLNGASIFAYVVGHKPDPVTLHVALPKGWKIINSAADTTDQTTFTFPNYDLLIDAPTEMGPAFEVLSFTVAGQTYRVMVSQLGEAGDAKPFVAELEKIVRTQVALMGSPDFRHYTFLFNFAPNQSYGDGMEHLASTNIIVVGGLRNPAIMQEALLVGSHEFFHVWNVKRLRPVELGPWDYSKEVHTKSLWIAEGLTNYYGDLLAERAGVLKPEAYYQELVNQIEMLERSPGRKLMSVEQSSWDTWFHLAAPQYQNTNLANTSISYYNKGELLGLLLDLEIRGRTNGEKSLDDVLRLMFKTFYEQPAATYYLKGKGYRPEDFLAAVNQVAQADFSDFFRRYVSGVEELDYNKSLQIVGLRLEQDPTTHRRRLNEINSSSPIQLKLRKAWLTGLRAEAQAN
ncbi:MAG: hypothetical protein K1Y36_29175 [Blastocatellia bacterium]|nr:hypothetical protein [Blastocatellia bacterium]